MKLAIFDFDGTLFKQETLPYLLKYWGKNGYSKKQYLKTYIKIIGLYMVYKLKLDPSMDKEKFRASAAKIFLGLFQGLKKDQVEDFFHECSLDMAKYFNPKIIERVKEAKDKGFHTLVCSGNYALSLEAIAKIVPFDTIIGTEIYFDRHDKLDLTKALHVVTGINKTAALLKVFNEEDVDWASSYSYGDSYYDYDILKLTGNPVAVSPDEKLLAIATSNHWEIIE